MNTCAKCKDNNKNDNPAMILDAKRELFNNAHNGLVFFLKHCDNAKKEYEKRDK